MVFCRSLDYDQAAGFATVKSRSFSLPIMIIRPVRKNRTRRRLTLEKLEGRSLMAGMPGFHNISMPMDVDNDLQISPLDALVVINRINSNVGIDGEDAADKQVTFCDVDADGTVSPLDVLAVVNELNANFEHRFQQASRQKQYRTRLSPDPSSPKTT